MRSWGAVGLVGRAVGLLGGRRRRLGACSRPARESPGRHASPLLRSPSSRARPTARRSSSALARSRRCRQAARVRRRRRRLRLHVAGAPGARASASRRRRERSPRSTPQLDPSTGAGDVRVDARSATGVRRTSGSQRIEAPALGQVDARRSRASDGVRRRRRSRRGSSTVRERAAPAPRQPAHRAVADARAPGRPRSRTSTRRGSRRCSRRRSTRR